MRESKFNPLYQKIIPKGEGAEYLGNNNLNVKEKRAMARFRTGGAGRAAEYWRSKEEKVCRLCGEAKETVSHMVKECLKGVKWKGRVEKLLGEDSRGLEQLMWCVKKIKSGQSVGTSDNNIVSV